MFKQVNDIVNKYYEPIKVKSIDIEKGNVYIDIIGQDVKKIDEKMKKEIYNLSVEKVSIIHLRE